MTVKESTMMLNASLGKIAAGLVKGDLKAKVKASMLGVLKGNWLEEDEECLLKAAVAGALQAVRPDTEEGRQLMDSIKSLVKVAAAFDAIRQGLKVEMPAEEKGTLPLLAWWKEAKAKVGKGDNGG